MIERAYEALRDAEFILELLEDCEDKRLFRIYFVACMTILRTVGQVLVSKNTKPTIKASALKLFEDHKSNQEKHRIFFDFVKKERDIIVHEYDINLGEDYDVVFSSDDTVFSLGDLYRPLADFEFDGEDVRDLIREAINWWVVQLKIIAEMP